MQFSTRKVSFGKSATATTLEKFILWFGAFGLIFMLLCDFVFAQNKTLQQVVYLTRGKEKYSVAQLCYHGDEYFLLMALLVSFWYSTKNIKYAPLFVSLFFDMILGGLICCFKYSPDWQDWDVLNWIVISLGIFVIQVIVIFIWPLIKRTAWYKFICLYLFCKILRR